jgi:hypothetical protein
MPSPKNLKTQHITFFPLLFLVLVMWIVYRARLNFPVWFDESIGKAVFFGLPVWLYLSLSRSRSIVETFQLSKIKPGVLLGMVVGGLLGFAGVLATVLTRHVIIQQAPLFTSDLFWGEFLLAILTGFWESLFFYSWVMVVIQEKYANWTLLNQVLLTAFIFLIFHLPNTLLRYSGFFIPSQLFLLFFFAIGQGLLFARTKNVYALTMSHAIWGMVLLVHLR